jgi:twinkle protein
MTDMLSEEHQAWLEERGIDLEVATRYGLYTDRQSQGGRDLVIPYRRDGKIVNRKYRGPQKRFRQDPGAPRMFWNEDSLRDATLANEPLVVTEGELDALAAIQAGFPRTVSVPDGAGSNLDFVGEVWPLVKNANLVILAGDGDEPGRKLNGELARRFGAARCTWVAYPDGTKDLGGGGRQRSFSGRQTLSCEGPLQAQRLSGRGRAGHLRHRVQQPQSASPPLAG